MKKGGFAVRVELRKRSGRRWVIQQAVEYPLRTGVLAAQMLAQLDAAARRVNK